MSKKSEYEHVVFDDFDRYISKQSGNASELMLKLYNDDIGINNAEKQLAGIRKHLDFKMELSKKDAKILGTDELEVDVENNEWIAKKTIRLSEDEKDDPISIMKKMNLDPAKWKCNWFKRRLSDWNVTIKNKDWEGEQYLNRAYSCEVSVTPKQDIITSEGIKALFTDLEPPEVQPYNNQYNSKFALALPILDNHTGKAGMTLKEQSDLYRKSVLDILGQIEEFGLFFDEVVIQIGQDHWHIDGIRKETSLGTRMDVNDDWSNIYKVGVRDYFWTIEQVRPITNKVFAYYVPGNHDKTLGLAAAYHFEKLYEDIEEVIVDSVNYPRKYHEYGLNMIGLSHGRDEGNKRIKNVMQVEAPKMWGRTKFREFLLGDEHHEEAGDDAGIIFRRIAAITHFDDFHIDKAYTMATRKAQALIYHEERGKRITIDSNVEIGVKNETGSNGI